MRLRLDRVCGLICVLCLLCQSPEMGVRPSVSNGDDATAQTEASPEPAAPSEDWPDFRNGLQLNGVAGCDLPADPQLIWEKAVTDGVTSTPAIVGDRVYVATLGGLVLCMNLANGDIIWEYSSVDPDEPSNFPPAFIAPLTVFDGVAYAGDDTGTLHAIDIATGERKWGAKLQSDIVGAANVVGDRVICGCSAGYLYGFSGAEGTELWKFAAQGPINGTQAFDGNRTFVTGCDQPILRVVDIETGLQDREVMLEGLLIASPALVNGVLYYGDDGGRVLAIDWNAGVNIWTYEPDGSAEIHSSPAVKDDYVVIGSRDRNVHCINRRTGEPIWVFPARGPIDCSPVIVGDRVFIASADKNIYGIRLSDGAEVWKYNTGERITGSPAVGRGRMVIGTEGAEGRILCFGE
jgi:outer membrane protein assembly factor BamB